MVLSSFVLAAMLAAMRWELLSTAVGAFGPPWWISLPVVGLLLVAVTSALWWRVPAGRARQIALAVVSAMAMVSVLAPATHVRAYRIERVKFQGPGISIAAVSYTHLTLPTSDLV